MNRLKRQACLIAFGCLVFIDLQAFSQELTGQAPWEASNLIHSRVGVLTVHNVRGPAYSVGAGWDHAYTEDFQLGIVLDYWDTDDRNIVVKDISFGTQGRFVFLKTILPFKPYTGGGIAVHRFQTETRQVQETGGSPLAKADRTRESQNKMGIDLFAGGLITVQDRMDVHAEFRYRRMLDRGLGLAHSGVYAGLSYRL